MLAFYSDLRHNKYMKYSLGLDIGTTSIGWAVIDEDNKRIHDVGVRIFEKPEHPKTGASLAEPRRTARSTRRRLKRRRQRLNTLKAFFAENDLLTRDEIKKLLSPENQYDPYEIRTRAIAEKVSNEELFLALYHIAKCRGYKSNSKAQDEDAIKRIAEQKEKLAQKREVGKEIKSNDERLKVLSAVYDNKGLLAKYETVSRALVLSGDFESNKRNKAGSYKNSFMRDSFEDEAKSILRQQRKLGLKLSDEKIEALLYGRKEFIRDDGIIIAENPGVFYQRPFMNEKLINGMRGKDIYNKQDRAAKASFTFELFRLTEDIAHIKNDKDAEWQITREQVDEIIKKAKSTKKVTYAAVREILGYKNDYDSFSFGYIKGKKPNTKKIKNFESMTPEQKDEAVTKEYEKATFAQMSFYHEICNALKNFPDKLRQLDKSSEFFDDLGEILTVNKDDGSVVQGLRALGFSDDEIQPLLLLNFSKFGNLSLETMRKATPLMLNGMTYDKALEEIYPGQFAEKLSGDKTKLPPLDEEQSQQITNPVVKRAVSQTIKVINAIVRKYGLPMRIGIEAAGDLAKSSDERDKIKKLQDENADRNDKIKNKLIELGVGAPTGLQITKFKLYEQQNGKCMYSGKPLDLNRLFADEHYGEIDHIIPFSRCGNDSLNNKVLVLDAENQNKGNLTPYEAWGNNEVKWADYEARVKATFLPFAKKDRLLAKSPPAEEWNVRALNDTRYISKFLRRYIKDNLKPAEKGSGKQFVITPTGSITSYLRRIWHVGGKVREDNNLHHAADACIIASVDQGIIQKVSSLNKYYELFRGNDKSETTDKLTGEIVHRGSVEQHIDDVQPWEDFGKEVRIRTAPYDHPSKLHNELRGLANYDEEFRLSARPIFVSRTPKRSGKGSTNQDTIRSPKIVEDYENDKGEKVVARKQRIALSGVKLKDLYDSPVRQTDPKLYEILKQRLEDAGDDPKKAFAEPIYKPTKDGSRGNIVRGIKVYDTAKSKTGFYINDGKAFVNNGSTIRLDVYKRKNFKGEYEYYFAPIYTYMLKVKKVNGKKVEIISNPEILPTPNGRSANEKADFDTIREADGKIYATIENGFEKQFSVYPNGYVRIYMKNKIVEGYYVKYDIVNAVVQLITHDTPGKDKSKLIKVSARSATEIQCFDISILGDNYRWL